MPLVPFIGIPNAVLQVLHEIGTAASSHVATNTNTAGDRKGGGGGSGGRAAASALLQGLGPDACVGALVCSFAHARVNLQRIQNLARMQPYLKSPAGYFNKNLDCRHATSSMFP